VEFTTIVCFEGEPPESPEMNLTKIVLFTSVLVHRIDVNLDFELATSAIGTFSHHFKAMTNTSSFYKKTACTEGSSASEGRIAKSLSGRKILVKRQMHKSRDTGGLSLAFCVQLNSFSLNIWRQNVPYHSYLRSRSSSNGRFAGENSFLPALKLFCFEVHEAEFGVEATFQRRRRRIVVKACLAALEGRSKQTTEPPLMVLTEQ
jgi:hypothetical protein